LDSFSVRCAGRTANDAGWIGGYGACCLPLVVFAQRIGCDTGGQRDAQKQGRPAGLTSKTNLAKYIKRGRSPLARIAFGNSTMKNFGHRQKDK